MPASYSPRSFLVRLTGCKQTSQNSCNLGCNDAVISPVLIDPLGHEFPCSNIETQPDNVEQASQWCALTPVAQLCMILTDADSEIMYSEMMPGNWTVVIQTTDADLAVQRVFTLSLGSVSVVVVTVRSGSTKLADETRIRTF